MTAWPRQVEYLRAMGVDVWLWREPGADETPGSAAESPDEPLQGAVAPADPAAGLTIGPGTGSVLLICGTAADTERPVAADIARCFRESPVWGWPAAPGSADGTPLEDAIRDRMFTGVLAFGEVAAAIVGHAGDGVRGSARILEAASLAELAAEPQARRRLWTRLRETGWCCALRASEPGDRDE